MTDIDPEVITRRAQEIRVFAEELRQLAKISKAAFLKNRERQYAVMHLLQLAIEACISVGNHIVSRKRLGIPQNYQDTFQLLARGGVLPQNFATEMMKMARFRNLLVHVYWETDLDRLYTVLTTRLGDFETFVRHILSKIGTNPPL